MDVRLDCHGRHCIALLLTPPPPHPQSSPTHSPTPPLLYFPKGTLSDNERGNAGTAQTPGGFQLTPCRLMKSNKVPCIYVCVCVRGSSSRMRSCVCMSVSLRMVAESRNRKGLWKKPVAECGGDPQRKALIGYLPKIFNWSSAAYHCSVINSRGILRSLDLCVCVCKGYN